MRDIDEEQLAETLEAACDSALQQDFHGLFTVSRQLKDSAEGADDPLLAVACGLDYHVPFFEDDTDQHPYGPQWLIEGESYPAPPEMVEELVPGTYSTWEKAAALAAVPAVRARLADLLWVVRFGSEPYRYARDAVDAYVEAAFDDFGTEVDRSMAIRRAFAIASELGDQESRRSVITQAVALSEQQLAEGEPPGALMGLLRLLVSLKPDERPEELTELLDDAFSLFGHDAWLRRDLTELAVSVATDPKDLRLQSAQAFLELANDSRGIARLAHLQTVIDIATSHGFNDLASEARRAVESMSDDDLGLHEVAVEFDIPELEIQRIVDSIVGDDDIESALTRLGSHIPTGDREAAQRHVEELQAEHPLQFLVTRIVIGPENAIIERSSGDDTVQSEVVRHQADTARLFGIVAVAAITEIAKRYGPLSDSDWFRGSDLIEPEIADRVQRALEVYEAGDSDTAAHLLAPCTERIIRQIAIAVGVPVTYEPTGSRHGGVNSLGKLLRGLEGLLDERSRCYLQVLLVDPRGLNLRNLVAHGLIGRVGQIEAALLVQSICHLRLMEIANS